MDWVTKVANVDGPYEMTVMTVVSPNAVQRLPLFRRKGQQLAALSVPPAQAPVDRQAPVLAP